jgi:hypothetical protein
MATNRGLYNATGGRGLYSSGSGRMLYSAEWSQNVTAVLTSCSVSPVWDAYNLKYDHYIDVDDYGPGSKYYSMDGEFTITNNGETPAYLYGFGTADAGISSQNDFAYTIDCEEGRLESGESIDVTFKLEVFADHAYYSRVLWGQKSWTDLGARVLFKRADGSDFDPSYPNRGGWCSVSHESEQTSFRVW